MSHILPSPMPSPDELRIGGFRITPEGLKMNGPLPPTAKETSDYLARERAELLARVASLEADKARLDRLEREIEQGRGSIELGITENGNIGMWRNDSDKTAACGDTLRAAIDAAREATK